MKKILLSIGIILGGLVSLTAFSAAQDKSEQQNFAPGDVPVLTDFQQISPTEGTFSFSAQYPKEAIEAAKQYENQGSSDKPIRIVAEIKIDDYEWQSCRVHSAELLEENKVFDSEIARKLVTEGTVMLRIKIIDNKEQFPETDWSDKLKIKAKGEKYEEKKDDSNFSKENSNKHPRQHYKSNEDKDKKDRTKLLCPLNKAICCKEFLGVSLCVWQAIVALIFLILVIVYRKIVTLVLLIIVLSVIFFMLRDKKPVSSTANHVNYESRADKDYKESEKASQNSLDPYSYRNGALQAFIDESGQPRQTEFVIKGLILAGNRHGQNEYTQDNNAENLIAKGFKTRSLFSSFWLNEYIEIYMDTDYSGPAEDVKIIAAPHQAAGAWEKMSPDELLQAGQSENGGFVMEYQQPQADNHNFIGENFVSLDYGKPGKYDILFIYKNKPAYFVVINMALEEPEEETKK